MNRKGFVLSTYVYMLLVFFLLLLVTMLAVLNNTKLLSNKLKEQMQTSSGLIDKDFSFVLLGDKNIVIRKDEEYIEPGYIAKTSKGKDIKFNVKIVGNVDESIVNSYILTYKLNYNGKTKELKRYVRVIDNNASNYISGLYKYNRDENNLIKDNTPDENIRYVGSNPNNYVYFNCKDIDSSNIEYGSENYDYKSSCEVWRIIGVFDVEDELNGEKLATLKIVSEALPEKMVWDSNHINQWGETIYSDGTVYNGSSLMLYLNKDTVGNYYYALSNIAKEQINETIWKTGAVTIEESKSIKTIYQEERGTNFGEKCNGGGSECTVNLIRTTEWKGKIGLIYPSDFAYAALSCQSNNTVCGSSNWLKPLDYYWTISHNATATYYFYSFLIGNGDSNIAFNSVGLDAFYVRPSLYLKRNVKITDGDGSVDNPYKLKLDE